MVIIHSKVKSNFLYNVAYNILVLIIPLITAPYISRIMGAEKIGIYSYSYSIASYFGLFILLGLNNYGNRTIAGVRNNKKLLSKTFWSIYIMQLTMAVIIIILYVIYICFIAADKIMATIQIIYLISVILDINWLFFGLEQFKLTVTRNAIVKILNVVLIFLLVKDKSDIYLYAIIMAIGPLLSQAILWCFLKKHVGFTKISFDEVIQHLKPNLILFIPVIAVSLYTVMDKIMLGVFSDMKEVGYYENANKLTQIPSMVVTSLGTVMLPRVSNLIANGNNREAIKYLHKSLIISMLLSCSMAFGLSAISEEFVLLFYGNGYEKCTFLIPVLVLSSIFIAWANVIRTQYLIPNKKDVIYIKSVFLGAIVNISINMVLIPYIQSIGAAVGTLIAEFSVCAYQTFYIRKEIKVWKYLKQSLPILISGLIMYLIVARVPTVYNELMTISLKISIGGIVYFVLIGTYYRCYRWKLCKE